MKTEKGKYDFLLFRKLFVTKEVREERLAICRSCENHKLGICVLCGCVVKAKVSVASTECPDDPPKWIEVKDLDKVQIVNELELRNEYDKLYEKE